MPAFVKSFLSWVVADWRSSPIRFFLETVGWSTSISTAIVLALHPQKPPMLWIFPCWIVGALAMSYAAWSRKSVGILFNSSMLLLLDLVGYSRLLAA